MNETLQKFKWVEATPGQLNEHPNLIERIYKAEVDGMTVKGFLNQEELDAIVANIRRRDELVGGVVQTETPFGYVVGKKLDREDGNFQKLPLDQYFKYTNTFRSQLKTILGFDLNERIASTLKPISGGRSLEAPVNPDDQVTFNAATIRICKPGGGGIHAHVGNEFNGKMADMKLLSGFARLYNQMSYFILLQKPENGGELDLFDLYWEDVKEQMAGDQSVVYNSIKNYKPYPVPLEAGDMIIFSGGRIWHQVKDVAGATDRITMGGFMAFSEGMDKIYFWS